MPDNLLQNLKCPNCSAKHLFKVTVTGVAEVSATKIGEITDVKWNEDSAIYCKSCYASGTVSDFTVRRGKKKEKSE